jgi:TRAP-type C4-dicarboxylate transport system substrate-binding protein
MNKSKWAKLTPAQHKIIMDINAEWADKHGEGWDSSDKAGIDFFKSKGGEFVPLSAEEAKKWEAAVAPIMDDYAEKVKEKGIDGKAVVEFIKESM